MKARHILPLAFAALLITGPSTGAETELPDVMAGSYLSIEEMQALPTAVQEEYCSLLGNRLAQLQNDRGFHETRLDSLQTIVDSLRKVVLEKNRVFRNLQSEVRQLKLKPKTATHYTVREGDTLTKISSLLFGTGAKWEKIYEANTDVLQGPTAALKPGTRLIIPKD